MRITEIRADTLTLGPTIVRVFTDAGLVGLSELGWQDPAIFAAHLERVIRPQLVGQDPLQPGRHWERLTAGTHDLPYPTSTSFAGVIDIALWDLMGKVAGLPIHTLLGGAARTAIPLYWSVGAGFDKTPEQMVADVLRGREQGFRAFKIRMDWGPIRCDVDPAKDLEMARQVRAALGPDVWLGFDANRGYSVGTAIRQGREFERLGLAHFEEPLPEHDMAGLREVCRALAIPVSTGEQLKHRWDFRDLIEQADPDILQPDIVDAGGISEVIRIFGMAEVFAKPVMPHSPSAGILSIASMHAYATVPSGVRPHEYSVEYGPSPERIAELFQESILPVDGVFRLSDRPGLGLTLDAAVFDGSLPSG
ncbi:MAG: mandelate racemase/muconate lactonizing enzyme family protein [Chloroflexota bacterium]